MSEIGYVIHPPVMLPAALYAKFEQTRAELRAKRSGFTRAIVYQMNLNGAIKEIPSWLKSGWGRFPAKLSAFLVAENFLEAEDKAAARIGANRSEYVRACLAMYLSVKEELSETKEEDKELTIGQQKSYEKEQ